MPGVGPVKIGNAAIDSLQHFAAAFQDPEMKVQPLKPFQHKPEHPPALHPEQSQDHRQPAAENNERRAAKIGFEGDDVQKRKGTQR